MAAYISGNGIRPGFVIVYNKELYRVMKAEHRTPGNLRAFCQAKLRNLKNGNNSARMSKSSEPVSNRPKWNICTLIPPVIAS
jgi:elongation factor P